MRKIRHRQALLILLLATAPTLSRAQDNSGAAPIIVPSQSSTLNQNSVFLPTPPVAHGQDIVRGSSGISCHSAVASGGPYVDVGLIGSQDVFQRDTAAFYGRVVVPIGKRPKRPDCTKLYELEISRLQLEIDLLRMGASEGVAALDAMMSEQRASKRPTGGASGKKDAPVVIQQGGHQLVLPPEDPIALPPPLSETPAPVSNKTQRHDKEPGERPRALETRQQGDAPCAD